MARIYPARPNVPSLAAYPSPLPYHTKPFKPLPPGRTYLKLKPRLRPKSGGGEEKEEVKGK